MSRRKDKLEASLEGLFSSKKQTRHSPADLLSPTGHSEDGDSEQRSPEAPFTLSEEPMESVTQVPAKTEETETAYTPSAPSTAITEVKSQTPQSNVAPTAIAVNTSQTLSISESKKTSIQSVEAQTSAPSPTVQDEFLQIVTFRLNQDFYGVDIADVQTIIKTQLICPVPFTPDYVEGLINLRGQIVPIINLRKRLGMPVIEVDNNSRLIIISTQDEWAGILVDEVSGVNSLPKNVIEPASSFISATETTLLLGIARTEKHLILILDMDAVFTMTDRSGKHML
jgi:purine-binding chemotaxis protein CheW